MKTFTKNATLGMLATMAMVAMVMAPLAVSTPASAQQSGFQLTLNDSQQNIPPAACVGLASGNATGTNGLTLTGASSAPTFQVQTSSTGTNTHTYTCTFDIPSRTNTGKGVTTVYNFNFFYGIQGAAMASLSTPTCGTIQLPNPATSETASTVTPVSVPITPFPAVASANLGTTTAGAFFTQGIFFSAPQPSYSGQNQKMQCTFVFNATATTATTTQTYGGTLYYQNVVN